MASPLRIVVVGGYGIFGGRLCRLLAPDARLALMVGGRSLKRAETLCAELPPGASRQAILFDREGDLQAQLQRTCPDLVIDASGPFQSYGDDPYRLVKACIACNVNYMDFADGSDFVDGIGKFDEAANERGIFVISGVSSFPVLTAAVIRRLSRDMVNLRSVQGGIAPSPFAGVGMNVIRAISAYAGQEVKLVRGGVPVSGRALTESMRYTIAPPGRLPLANIRFSLVDVPDLQVLPKLWPRLDMVWMGAGTVPEVLHLALNGLSWLVRIGALRSLSPFAIIFFHVMNTLRWGEHRGGMFVHVNGIATDGSAVSRSWHLLAEGDDGPLIPCMALEALVQRSLAGYSPPPGARPASKELELEDYERLFSRRTIFTGEREAPASESGQSVFKTLLGDAWPQLPAPIQAMHSGNGNAQQIWVGEASVERGTGWASWVVAKVFGFPSGGALVPVRLHVDSLATAETWSRSFGERSFSSSLSLGTGRSHRLLCERFGPFTFALALVLDESKLHYVVRRWSVLGLVLPRFLAPGGNSFESTDQNRFCFHVEITQPLIGLIVRYKGWLVPATP